MRIYYLVPDETKPSWGMGIIYHHVHMLSAHGFDAWIIKEKNLETPKWLNLKMHIECYNYLHKQVKAEDIVVVPEAMMNFPGLKKLPCHKILFVQASAYLFESMPKGEDHKSLGFEEVMIIMPHMISIVQNHIKLPYVLIPPFVADYFYHTDLLQERKKQVLIFPKFHQIDYSIVKYLVEKHIHERNGHWAKKLFTQQNWSLIEMKGYTHTETAGIMKASSFFISLNAFEALNTSVTEAMAAGCISFCYEGFGPKDYLKRGDNAFVFDNNAAFELAEAVCTQIDQYEHTETARQLMQANAFTTVQQYKKQPAEAALVAYFTSKT